MSTSTYTVSGMTCDHCVASVTEEISEIAGAGDVEVDLDSGEVTVTTADPAGVDEAAVRAAVAIAGYRVVNGPSGVPG